MEYNKHIKVLYKETEDKFTNDPEVDQDDLQFMCHELYRYELLAAFGLEKEEIDFNELTRRIEEMYEFVKNNDQIIELIKQNYIENDLTTFLSLFSYDTFHVIHKLIVEHSL